MKTFWKATALAFALTVAAAPAIAEAQPRQDRREWRQDRREDRREFRQDRRGPERNFRQDRRQDRREYQRDRRQDQRWDRRDDRRDNRWDRRDDRREWRQDRRVDYRWDRSNRNWYVGRPEFRDYRGHRAGYWYAPSYGYHRVQPRYANYSWRRGSVLPYEYRRYYVNDPYFYNLRPAPRGYRWVHANNDILLVALATGVIADTLLNVY